MSEFQTQDSDNVAAPIRVLEIGYGNSPAAIEGILFSDPNVSYIGVELPTSFAGCFKFSWSEQTAPNFTEVVASSLELPFRSNVFDYALLRSVYGQFASRPEVVSSIRCGMFEVVRVLKDQGQVMVAEENTPLSPRYIETELESAGLVIDDKQTMPAEWSDVADDDPWKIARSQFYIGKPLGAFNDYDGPPHLVIAHKPTDLQTKPYTREFRTDFYKPREEWSEEWREVTLETPVRDSQNA